MHPVNRVVQLLSVPIIRCHIHLEASNSLAQLLLVPSRHLGIGRTKYQSELSNFSSINRFTSWNLVDYLDSCLRHLLVQLYPQQLVQQLAMFQDMIRQQLTGWCVVITSKWLDCLVRRNGKVLFLT